MSLVESKSGVRLFCLIENPRAVRLRVCSNLILNVGLIEYSLEVLCFFDGCFHDSYQVSKTSLMG
jgi:hypothetical protein